MDWIQYADSFAKTFLAFWQMKARVFVATTKHEGAGYLSPYRFLICVLLLSAVIYSASFALTFAAAQEVTGEEIQQPIQAMVVRTLVILVVFTVINAMLDRAVSRVWPVRGCGTFSQILEFRLYMLACIMPVVILDLLIGPVLVFVSAQEPELAAACLLFT